MVDLGGGGFAEDQRDILLQTQIIEYIESMVWTPGYEDWSLEYRGEASLSREESKFTGDLWSVVLEFEHGSAFQALMKKTGEGMEIIKGKWLR